MAYTGQIAFGLSTSLKTTCDVRPQYNLLKALSDYLKTSK